MSVTTTHAGPSIAQAANPLVSALDAAALAIAPRVGETRRSGRNLLRVERRTLQ
jgi:hypothetical protein